MHDYSVNRSFGRWAWRHQVVHSDNLASMLRGNECLVRESLVDSSIARDCTLLRVSWHQDEDAVVLAHEAHPDSAQRVALQPLHVVNEVR